MEIKSFFPQSLKSGWEQFVSSEFYRETFGWAIALIRDIATRKEIPNPEAEAERGAREGGRESTFHYSNKVRQRDDKLHGNI